MNWAIAATWSNAREGVVAGAAVLAAGGSALDAAEAAARVCESDPGNQTVGRFGLPNAEGVVECDAAVMDGRDLSMGCVMGLAQIEHAVSVARLVMGTPHTVLCGEGAYKFARAQGFAPVVMTDDKGAATYEKEYALRLKNGTLGLPTHDTVGVIAMDREGNIAAATSTSGLFFKMPGRVGDTPLPGCGFFADNEKGAAVATGVGEDIMRGVICDRVVQLMAGGMSPQKAAEVTVLQLHNRRAKAGHEVGHINVLCMNVQGEFGGASNRGGGFSFFNQKGDLPLNEEKRHPLPNLIGEAYRPFVEIGV